MLVAFVLLAGANAASARPNFVVLFLDDHGKQISMFRSLICINLNSQDGGTWAQTSTRPERPRRWMRWQRVAFASLIFMWDFRCARPAAQLC